MGFKKRGQITMFIIVAIAIIAVAGIIFYINNNQKNIDKEFFEQVAIKPQLDALQTQIMTCMDEVTLGSLDLIGIQGGYYNAPADYFDLQWAILPYYYNQGKFAMPTTSTIENELAKAIDNDLTTCLNLIQDENFETNYKTPKTKVSIEKQEVKFDIDLPISIKKQDKTMTLELEDYPITQTSSLYDMIEIAKYITDSHKEDPEMICITCIADMARDKNLYVDFLDFTDPTTTLVTISNNETSAPFVFEFLNKYPVA